MSTAAKQIGTCQRCGGALYEFLVHHCRTAITPPTSWTTGETPEGAHACNCIGCCPACGTCRTWHGHTAAYCEMLVRQAAERATHLAESRAFTSVTVVDSDGEPVDFETPRDDFGA